MRKLTVFMGLIVLGAALAVTTCAAQNRGGSGESAGRLDGSDRRSENRRSEEGSPYYGGPGDGHSFGEYAGPIDNTKKKPEEQKKTLRERISQFFKRCSR